MASEEFQKNHAHRLTLFSVSAGMVGVCLTGVGLIGVVKSMRRMETITDEVLTVSALLYLLSTALYFIVLRHKDQARRTWIDVLADAAFFFALALLLVACVVLTLGFRYIEQ